MEITIEWTDTNDAPGYLISTNDDNPNFPQAPAPGPDYHYKGRDRRELAAIARRAYRYHTGKDAPRGTTINAIPRD